MAGGRPRARQSRHRRRSPLTGPAVASLLVAAVCGGLLAVSAATVRALDFLHSVVNFDNPVKLLTDAIEPPQGSVAWKLRYGEQVNILALGYGGPENDAPWLTDSLMIISIDPGSRRVMEVSIPRDLWVRIDAWADGRVLWQKVNAAFEVGNEPSVWSRSPLAPQFRGRDGPGHLVEHVIGELTGLTFDRYVAVDFRAFRDVVDALGGIDVHMETPLDDCHYPDYHDGYLNHGVPPGFPCPRGAGIHFPAGDYHVNGEQALELARSRDAIQAQQASDFDRSRRQQMILAAVHRRVTSTGAILQAPALMAALQKDFKSDFELTDLKALYDFGAKLGESSILHLAVTDRNLVNDNGGSSGASCGPPDTFVLCPQDPSYRTWQALMSRLFVPSRTLVEHAPVQLVNATVSIPDLQARVQDLLQPLGFQLVPGGRTRPAARTVIYDASGGRYPQTVAWLEDFFGATLAQGEPPAAVPRGGQAGLVVVMGSDFGRRWLGLQPW